MRENKGREEANPGTLQMLNVGPPSSKRQRTITIANGLPVAYGINRLDSHFRSVSEIPE